MGDTGGESLFHQVLHHGHLAAFIQRLGGKCARNALGEDGCIQAVQKSGGDETPDERLDVTRRHAAVKGRIRAADGEDEDRFSEQTIGVRNE